jgi:peptide/nickel transport system substrate-binding protein
MSRRRFLQWAGLTGASVAGLGTLLAACGSDSSTSTGAATNVSSSGGSQSQSTGTTGPGSASTTTASPASTAGTSGASGTKSVLKIGWGEDFLSLDPSQMRETMATELGYKIYSSLVLVKSGSPGEFVGDLATKWDISPDGMEFTFNLQPNAKWHKDYGDVTAEDVKYSFMRHKDEAVASHFEAEAGPIKDVEVVDPHTAKVVMSQAYPAFFTEFAAYRPGFIVNKKAIDEFGKDYSSKPIGSGPFVFTNWSPKEKVQLTRFADFYGNAGVFETVEYNIISEEATREIALEHGDIDICYLTDPSTQSKAESDKDLNIAKAPGPRTYYIQLNNEKKPFDDVRVRQALWFAIDRNAITKGVLKGQADPAYSLLNSYCFGQVTTEFNPYDPDKAKSLLEEAGVKPGVQTSMLIEGDDSIASDMGAAIQAMWKEIGVEAKLELVEWASHVEKRKAGNFDLGLQPQLRLGSDQYFGELVASSSIPYPNCSRFKDDEMDNLIETARVTPDDEQRKKMYEDLQKLTADKVPVIPIIHPSFMVASQGTIHGAVVGLVTINVTELTVSG